MKTDGTDQGPPGFWQIFLMFFGISSLTIGGGYVMVPVIQRAVAKRGWLPEDEFYDLFAMAQVVPGPLALNTATFVGRRLAGFKGFAAGFLGVILPPFVAIVALAAVIGRVRHLPAVRGFLEGAYAVVPGLVAAFAVNMVRKRKWTATRAALSVAGAAALILSGSWAVPVFFAVAVTAWLAEGRAR